MIMIPQWLKTDKRKGNDDARDQLSAMRQAIKNQTEKLEKAIKEASARKEVNDGN